MNRAGVIIQARMGSSRLPGKILLPLGDLTLLEWLLVRIGRAKKIDTIVVATTVGGQDDPVVEIIKPYPVKILRGSEDDVLDRYFQAARHFELDPIVRLTADCPFADPVLLDAMLDEFERQPGCQYLSNTLERTFPRGFDIEIFSFAALAEAHEKGTSSPEREHVTPYMKKNLPAAGYALDHDSSRFRVTVDTREDYELAMAVADHFKGDHFFPFTAVIEFLEANPGVANLNAGVAQKAG